MAFAGVAPATSLASAGGFLQDCGVRRGVHESRRRFARAFSVLGFRTLRWLLLLLVPVPAVRALGATIGLAPALLLATALLAPLAFELRALWDPRPRRRARLLATLAGYAFWTACLFFALLAPVAWGIERLWGDAPGWLGGGRALLSVLAGLRAVWPRPRLVERAVRIPGLPPALDGYRIAHLSDVHCGPFTPEHRVRRWVDRLNATRPDLVAITGDLITQGNLYIDAVASALGGLRARDGVFACLGNHEYFGDVEALVEGLEAGGVEVLRNRGVTLGRADARLYVAGVDDTWTRRNDMPRAVSGRPDGVPAVLLAHDPNLFPQAVSLGVELTLSGHTHGGQLGVPGLSRRFNIARVVTAYTTGLYRAGDSALYVSRGAGTTGPPVRIAAPAELTVLTLRAAPPAAAAAGAAPRSRAAG